MRCVAFFVLAPFALLVSIAGCSAAGKNDTAIQVPANGLLLRGAGATFPSVLYAKWFSTYESAHPETVVHYDAVGSGEGTDRFIGRGIDDDKKVEFGASDAAMTDQQISSVPEGVILLPVTAGSVVLVYNLPDLAQDLRLSRKAYTGIFLGEIKNWSDPEIAESNPGVTLPDLTIAPVVRQEPSGTTFAFTKHLDAISKPWRDRYGAATLIDWPSSAMRAPGNEGVASRVARSVGGIGYVGYEFAHKLGLKTAILENSDGKFVGATGAATAAAIKGVELPDNLRIFAPDPSGADAYPIVTFSWILLRRNYDDSKKARALRGLFQWCLQDGQNYAEELGYIPLPTAVVMKSLSALNGLHSGS